MGDLSKDFRFSEFFTEGKNVQEMACYHVPDIYQRIKKN
jgi:hypothetical protein